MKKNNLKGSLILCTASLIWGFAFVAQSGAAKLIPSYTFNALRSFIGAIVLYLFLRVKGRKEKTFFFPKCKADRNKYFIAAVICGILLTASVNFQQVGLALYPDGVASEARGGFITALYVVLVPLISIFAEKKINLFVWLSTLIAIAGIYLLCLSGGINGIYIGDILIFCCSVCFTVHILAIDKYVNFVGGIKLSVMQFVVCGVISSVMAAIFENPSINNVIAAAPQILYLGIFSSGIAYTLQIVGQRYAEPAVASLSMSLESVFAALGGWIISGNSLTLREICGCTLVFFAIVAAQTPELLKKKA